MLFYFDISYILDIFQQPVIVAYHSWNKEFKRDSGVIRLRSHWALAARDVQNKLDSSVTSTAKNEGKKNSLQTLICKFKRASFGVVCNAADEFLNECVLF